MTGDFLKGKRTNAKNKWLIFARQEHKNTDRNRCIDENCIQRFRVVTKAESRGDLTCAAAQSKCRHPQRRRAAPLQLPTALPITECIQVIYTTTKMNQQKVISLFPFFLYKFTTRVRHFRSIENLSCVDDEPSRRQQAHRQTAQRRPPPLQRATLAGREQSTA